MGASHNIRKRYKNVKPTSDYCYNVVITLYNYNTIISESVERLGDRKNMFYLIDVDKKLSEGQEKIVGLRESSTYPGFHLSVFNCISSE